jgi:hypothetical protein
METLMLVVEQNGPTMFARIATMRALNQHIAKSNPAPRRKTAKEAKADGRCCQKTWSSNCTARSSGRYCSAVTLSAF